MSNPIAQEAVRALTATGYPIHNNRCQKFARIVVQTVVGDKYDKWLWKDSALLAGNALLVGGLGFRASEVAAHGGLQEGDVLYKTQGSGGQGHVGIYIGNSRVAENSTTHWNRTGGRDARGIRTLAEFGAYQVVVRFPIPGPPPPVPVVKVEPAKSVNEKQSVIIITRNGDRTMRVVTVKNGADNWAKVRDMLEAVGLEVEKLGTWSDGSPALYLKG